YLVFPRANPVLTKHRRLVLGALYGIPAAWLVLIWAAMLWSRWLASFASDDRVAGVLLLIQNLALGYIGLAVIQFGFCVLCLVLSFRGATGRAERNQVQWILLASLIASLLIGYLLSQAWSDPLTLGRDSAAWPMFGVSLLYTLAYALSI